MAGELIYIGIVHIDPRGGQRLEKLLNQIKPEILTVEVSDEKLKSMDAAREEIRLALKQKGLNQELAEKYVSISIFSTYEWTVSRDYAKKQDIPIHKVDIRTQETAEMSQRVVEMLKNRYLTDEILEQKIRDYEACIKLPIWQNFFDKQFYSSVKVLASSPDTQVWLKKRDAFMAEKISDIIEKNPDKRVVHVGGALHMVENEGLIESTLYMLLPPNRVYFLSEAENIS